MNQNSLINNLANEGYSILHLMENDLFILVDSFDEFNDKTGIPQMYNKVIGKDITSFVTLNRVNVSLERILSLFEQKIDSFSNVNIKFSNIKWMLYE